MNIYFPSNIYNFSINQTAKSTHETTTLQPSKLPCKLHVIKGLALAALFILPVMIVRITAYAVSIFGQCGKQAAIKIHQKADKLDAILIKHHTAEINLLFDFKIRLLTQAKNIATKNAIWNEHDCKEAQKYITTAKKMESLSPETIEQLRNFSVKGAATDGICYGASLYAIKTLKGKKIKTEDALIKSVENYKSGFPAEAAGLQNLFEAFGAYELTYSPSDIEQLKKKLAKFKQEIMEEKNREIEEINTMVANGSISIEAVKSRHEEIIKSLTKSCDEFEAYCRSLILHNKKVIQLEKIASLIDLQLRKTDDIYESSNFKGISRNTDIQEKFNALKNGYYQVHFITESSGHSIVYIKKKFGSYILDPNFGLIKCDQAKPAHTMIKLLQFEVYSPKSKDNNSVEHNLRVYSFVERVGKQNV